MSNAITQDVEARILELVTELADTQGPIDRDSALVAIDIDSLDLVEIGQVVEEEMGVTIDGDDIKDLATVGQVIDLVASRVR